MATFRQTRQQTEQKVLVHLFSEIERNPSFTQRGLAAELGIALGLMNQYLKRCMTKGWIRASQISPHRISYFLTTEGFKEKSQLLKDYLARSFTFFRDARTQCEQAFLGCKAQNWLNVALIGDGDLADIAKLVAHGTGITLTISNPREKLAHFDAVIITDVTDPQAAYEKIKNKVQLNRLITLPLLHISPQQETL